MTSSRNASFNPSRPTRWIPKESALSFEQIVPSITIFEQNANSGYPPGSLEKLLTTAAALEYLGPDFKYSTTLAVNGRIVGKTVLGNLVVQGSGDPTFGSWLAGNPEDPTLVFRNWAKELKASGITVVQGGIVGDDDLFDDQMEGPAWPIENRGEWQLAQVSALTFDDNCIEVVFKGARKVGKLAAFSLKPKTDYILFGNHVLTGAENKVELKRQAGANLIAATGTILPKKEYTTRASVENPTLYAITIMKDVLMHEGINIKGELVDIDALREKTSVTSGTLPIAVHISPPLSEIIAITNHFSQNLYAELLLKTLGQKFGEGGSFQGGCQVLDRFFQENHVDSSLIGIRDGSGLSSRDSLTPRFIVDLLGFMSKSRYADVYERSLSRPGEYGAMQFRFANIVENDPTFTERVRCISGYSSGTASLAGYVTTPEGIRLAFAVLVNDPRMEKK